jgi:hypothetical protein
MRFILAYVNLPNNVLEFNIEFQSIAQLMAHVQKDYPNFTSYSVTVLP